MRILEGKFGTFAYTGEKNSLTMKKRSGLTNSPFLLIRIIKPLELVSILVKHCHWHERVYGSDERQRGV